MEMSNNEIEKTNEEMLQSEYISVIEDMFGKAKKGTLNNYTKLFFLKLSYKDWWSQPQVSDYCNKMVVVDGGVGWNTKHGAKNNTDGSSKTFGDPGRQLEQIRTERFEGCFDNQSGNKDGPFRLNLDTYKNYTGSTKCHSFSDTVRKEILKRANGKCELCGFKGKIEIDHFIPKEKGGESTLSNANALCCRCNDRKCNKDPQLFMEEECKRVRTYFTSRGLTLPVE